MRVIAVLDFQADLMYIASNRNEVSDAIHEENFNGLDI